MEKKEQTRFQAISENKVTLGMVKIIRKYEGQK